MIRLRLLGALHSSGAARLLGRASAFWQTEYWDRFIRNDEPFAATESFIDQNPVKAGLVEAAHVSPYGRALEGMIAPLEWRAPSV